MLETVVWVFVIMVLAAAAWMSRLATFLIIKEAFQYLWRPQRRR
jgi:hypothetical protein